jgi:RNA recognition motif-containing protein
MSAGRVHAAKETIVMGRKLFVGNLSFNVGEAELQTLFGGIGEVESVQIMRERDTGRARGFAFVEMVTEEDAQRATTELNETEFEGRRLTVNEARPRPATTGGGRSFGGGGGSRRRSEPRW